MGGDGASCDDSRERERETEWLISGTRIGNAAAGWCNIYVHRKAALAQISRRSDIETFGVRFWGVGDFGHRRPAIQNQRSVGDGRGGGGWWALAPIIHIDGFWSLLLLHAPVPNAKPRPDDLNIYKSLAEEPRLRVLMVALAGLTCRSIYASFKHELLGGFFLVSFFSFHLWWFVSGDGHWLSANQQKKNKKTVKKYSMLL